MMQRILIGRLLLSGLLLWWLMGAGISFAQEPGEAEPLAINPQVRLKTSNGEMVVELFPKTSPQAVNLFLQYVKAGRYNRLPFERYAEGFAIQLANPKGASPRGADTKVANPKEVDSLPVPDERNNGLTHVQGAVGLSWDYLHQMSGNKLYICLAAVPQLDNKHTLIGLVSEGLELLLALRPGDKLETITISEPSPPPKTDATKQP